MSLWKRITPEAEKVAEEEFKSANKAKEPPIEFYPEEPKYSFDEIILPQSVKDKILDVANYAENSKRVFEDWGLQAVYKQSRRIGINLYGETGTGKTMAAHAIAKHLGRKILAVNYSDIESKYVGETPKNIRKAFEAVAATNSILFFDEADAILSKRVTNFISNFDPAFMRRISTHIEFKLPDLDCRKKIWQHYILPTMPNNIDIDELAEKYDGISGSDISNAVLMAAFKAARQNAELVDKSLVFAAVEETLASKNANAGVTVEKRVVSEKYIKERLAAGKAVIKGGD